MKEIYYQLINKNYREYWKDKGINKRLKSYTAIAKIGELISLIITLIISIIFTSMIIRFTIDLLDGSSALYGMRKQKEIINLVEDEFITITVLIVISIFLFLSFIDLYGRRQELFFVLKTRVNNAIKSFPIFFSCVTISLTLLQTYPHEIWVISITLLILHFMHEILEAYIYRVTEMNDYANGIKKVYVLSHRGLCTGEHHSRMSSSVNKDD